MADTHNSLGGRQTFSQTPKVPRVSTRSRGRETRRGSETWDGKVKRGSESSRVTPTAYRPRFCVYSNKTRGGVGTTGDLPVWYPVLVPTSTTWCRRFYEVKGVFLWGNKDVSSFRLVPEWSRTDPFSLESTMSATSVLCPGVHSKLLYPPIKI